MEICELYQLYWAELYIEDSLRNMEEGLYTPGAGHGCACTLMYRTFSFDCIFD